MKKIIVSLDWGGTFIKLGVFSRTRLLFTSRFSSRQFSLPQKFFAALDKSLRLCLKKKGLNYRHVAGLGVGAPGIIDIKKGIIHYLPNISGWEEFPFRKACEEHFPFPLLSFDNDANFAAWGEFCQGALRGSRHAVLITLGTGLGCGLIINRRLFHSHTSAAEAGHMALSLRGKKCSCSAYGCAETFLGQEFFINSLSRAFRRKYRIRNLEDLFKEARRGRNRPAQEYWQRYGRILGRFLAGLVNLLNPDRIALGGGASGAFRLFQPALEKELRRQAIRPMLGQMSLVPASLGNTAGIWGGFWLAKKKAGL